jgi:predicted amidohydrolase
MKIGIAQINPTVGDFEANGRKIAAYITKAVNSRLDWVIFPEMSLCGYPVWDLANKRKFVEENKRGLDRLVRFTKGNSIIVVVGFVGAGGGFSGKSSNALAFIRNGKVVHTQCKTLLPTYDVFLEQLYFEPATEHRVFSWKGWKVGATICEDIWDQPYAVKPLDLLKARRANLILNISASPFHRNVARIREDLITAQAKKHRAWLLYVNQVGGQDDLVFDGRSLLSDPSGRLVFRGEPFREAFYEISVPSRVRGTSGIPLSKGPRPEELYEALVLGVRDYVRKNGFKSVVIGLSGGIDSALTATIAADALGPSAVLGITMPANLSRK